MFLMMVFGAALILPFDLFEHFFVRPSPLTVPASGTIVFITLSASVLAQMFFAERVLQLGAPTAGNMI